MDYHKKHFTTSDLITAFCNLQLNKFADEKRELKICKLLRYSRKTNTV